MAIPTWVDTVHFDAGNQDITAYGRDKVGWATTIGATSIVQTGFVASPGSYQSTLSNGDLRFDPNYASSPYAPDVIPNVLFDKLATFAATDYNVITGKVDEWPQTYPGSGVDQTVAIQVADGVKDFSEAAQVTFSRPPEYSGQRIQAIVDEIGWPGPVDISHGVSIVTPIRRRGGSISAWSHISDCVNAEWGDLYFDTDGTLVFRDRDLISSETRSTTSQATFSDQGPLNYSNIAMANLPIVNDCTITYGTRGRSVNVNDPTSIATFGLRSLPLTLPLQTKSAARQYATWIVARYKDPITTVASITLAPHANPTGLFPQVLGRKLSDLITVGRTQIVDGVQGTTVPFECWIRGISHQYSDHVWKSTTFYLQDASWRTDLFVWDVSSYDGADVWGL